MERAAFGKRFFAERRESFDVEQTQRTERASFKEVIEVGKAHGAPVAVNIECDLQNFFRTTSHRGGEEERGRLDILCNSGGLWHCHIKAPRKTGSTSKCK